MREKKTKGSFYNESWKSHQMAKKISYIAIALGLLITLISILADYFGLGNGGIQAAQLLGAQAGIILALGGVGLKIFDIQDGEKLFSWRQAHALVERILYLPVIFWILIPFLGIYFIFFVSPVFLNEKLQMAYLNRYLPHTGMIGADLRVFLEYIEAWLNSGQSPYVSGYIAYPPFSFILFSPLVLVGYPGAYRLITVATLISYFIVTLAIPMLLTKGKSFSIILFIFIIGLFSYGLQFELERGQSNLIAFMFCLLGVYLFHYHKRFRLFAYILFSISIQLKLYPAIFFVLFFDDWRDWEGNVKRMLGIALSNVALLFVMGYAAFIDFTKAIMLQQFNLSQWNGNHSIRAFAVNFTSHGFGLFDLETLTALGQSTRTIEIILMGILGFCIGLVIWILYRREERGFNPFLLLASTLGALVIPSVSNDYKLSVLPAAAAILLSQISVTGTTSRKIFTIIMIILFSSAFWSALYPFKVKPEILSSSFPIIFLMLITGILLYLAIGRASQSDASKLQ